MAKPLQTNDYWRDQVLEQINGLEYGSVLITVHDGRIVQIDRTDKRRFDTNAGSGSASLNARRYNPGLDKTAK